MKFTKIYPNKIGLVFIEGTFLRAIGEGRHWLRFGETVQVFDKVGDFIPTVELSLLLQDEMLQNELNVVTVKDTEFCIVFKNGNFLKVLYAGQYAFWKSVITYDFQIVDTTDLEVSSDFDVNLFKHSMVKYFLIQHIVESYEEGLLFVDGVFVKKLTPGIYNFWKNTNKIVVLQADYRKQQMEVSGQELLTKDKAAIRINFDVQYKIQDIELALIQTKDVYKQTYLLMQMAIRAYIGTLTLDELLSKKDGIKDFVMEQTAEQTAEMGVQIITCGIRDIILPGDVKNIMNQVLIAEKTAQANMIMRREETASTRSLLNTAKLMENNEMLFKLKEMEYIEKIADKINDISLSGGGQIVEQLKGIFSVNK